MNTLNWNYVQPTEFDNSGLANVQAQSRQGVNDALRAFSDFSKELVQKEENRLAEAEFERNKGMLNSQLNEYRNAIKNYNEARTQMTEQMRGLVNQQAQTIPTTASTDIPVSAGNGLVKPVAVSKSLQERASQYMPLFLNASRQYNVPLDVLLAVAQTESDINPNVVSPTGVRGIMQVTQNTYNGLGFTGDRALPENSINAGAKLLSQLYGKYGNWEDAWYAYNGGHNGVTGIRNGNWGVWANNAGKIKEIQGYVPKVTKYRQYWQGVLHG